MSKQLPQHVIDTDHRLEEEAEAKTRQLHEHRWHWTLDESNPGRVSLRQYAKEVSRSVSTISKSANGFAAWRDEQVGGDVRPRANTRTLHDHIERAGVGEKKRQAAEAIAEAEGVTEGNVLKNRRHDVHDLIDAAEEAAAQPDGMTVEDEMKDRAKKIAQVKANKQQHKADEKSNRSAVMLEVDTHLVTALTRLKKAAAASTDVLSEEDREILEDLVRQCRAALDFMDMKLSGQVDVDWDAELAKLGGDL